MLRLHRDGHGTAQTNTPRAFESLNQKLLCQRGTVVPRRLVTFATLWHTFHMPPRKTAPAVPLVRFFARLRARHQHTDFSPHRWAELVQLPSIRSFARHPHTVWSKPASKSLSLGPTAVLGDSITVPNHIGQGRKQTVVPIVHPHIILVPTVFSRGGMPT